MFDSVLVGVDGRAGGRDAIALASQLVAPGGTVTLANVHTRDLYRLSGRQPHFDAALSAESAEILERERAATAVSAIASAGAPSVAAGLHQLAREHHADLLVIGSCARSLVGRVLLGNGTRDSLRGSPCAVAVAPKEYAEHPRAMRSIGVGFDGEPESEVALETARELATGPDGEIHLLYAVPPVAPALASMAPVDNGELIAALLQRGSDRLAQVEGADGQAVVGMAGEMLTDFSEDVDLLVLGSCGRGAVARALVGSTGEHVAQHAHCPVLLAPRSDTVPAALAGQSADRAG
jgi:nucleotide-binding universal stress UspA family protein